MQKTHLFGEIIGEQHKTWLKFYVACGKLIDKEFVTDDSEEVSCKNCWNVYANHFNNI